MTKFIEEPDGPDKEEIISEIILRRGGRENERMALKGLRTSVLRRLLNLERNRTSEILIDQTKKE